MIPTRHPGRSSHTPHLARTFMTNDNPFQPTRVRGPPSLQQAPHVQGGGMTTTVRPGEPHYFACRTDRQRGLALGNLCQCQNPAGHGDAWSLQGPTYAHVEMDIRGNRISWAELSNRVLDYYGKPVVTRKEEYESYRYLLHPMCYRNRMRQYHELNRHVAMGLPVICTPYQNALQSHGGDGHTRNAVTEGGVRTMVDRHGHFPAPGPPSGSSRGPRFLR